MQDYSGERLGMIYERSFEVLTELKNWHVPILMYHSISEQASAKFRPFTVSPRSFVDQMAYLHRYAYTPLTVSQLAGMRSQPESTLPKHPVVLTFDDGYADFLTEALPVLKQYGFPATLYIATAFVNGTSRWMRYEGEMERPMLTWAQLKQIAASDIECGAHTHTHPQLDILTRSRAQDEIRYSKKLLEDHLDQTVNSFAYPYGYLTTTLRQQVQEAGFTSACSVDQALHPERIDVFALTRLIVNRNTELDQFVKLLNWRRSSTVRSLYRQIKDPVWRCARYHAASVKQYLQM
jgi:peptidoglycan/xylan/chitin deacetylase (PgdA/CDA1 family)